MFQNLFKKNRRVFLDFASATPTRTEVLDVMREYSQNHFANPSALYIEARQAKETMQQARAEIGEFFNCTKESIIFTSGGTEANNIAILGVFEQARKNGVTVPHIVSILTEHPSVREVLDEILRRGGEVTLLKPNTDGLITPQQVEEAIKENTILVSIMYVNNEIGVVQPIRQIARAVKRHKAIVNSKSGEEFFSSSDSQLKTNASGLMPYLHLDACQAALFYTLDVSTLGVDLLTLDGLKIYGPAGVGCLYIRHGVDVSPIMFGGGQENGLRSGTEDVASMVGFAKALSLAKIERKELSERLEKLRDYFIDEILKRFSSSQLNGSHKYRSPNNINICFSHSASDRASRDKQGLDAEYLVVALDTYGVSASYSSSCRTLKEDSSSYVVEALYKFSGKPDCSLSSIRFTLGRTTTKSDIDFALEALEKAVNQVRKN